ncbi:unnamed protein product [Diamesa serratosioi]
MCSQFYDSVLDNLKDHMVTSDLDVTILDPYDPNIHLINTETDQARPLVRALSIEVSRDKLGFVVTPNGNGATEEAGWPNEIEAADVIGCVPNERVPAVVWSPNAGGCTGVSKP